MIRLVTDIYYYVLSSGDIVFTDTSKKIFNRKAEALVWRHNDKIVKKGILRTNKNFQMKIIDSEIYASHPSIFSGKFFRVLGAERDENLLYILEECDVTKGNVSGTFEVAFLEEDYQMIHPFFIQEGTKKYEEAWEGFVRTTNMTFRRKTKILKPGHRYDFSGGTLWYIGEFGTTGETKKKGFIGGLPNPGISIEDALKNVKITQKITKIIGNSFFTEDGKRLILVESVGSMADSGETMANSDWVIDPHTLWKSWNNQLTVNNLPDYITLYRVTPDVIDNQTKDLVSEVLIEYLLEKTVIPFEGISCGGTTFVATESSKDVRNEKLEKLWLNTWPGTTMFFTESKETLKNLGVDIENVFDEVVRRFLMIDFSDFDTFLKYNGRFGRLNSKKYCRSISIRNKDVTTDGKALRGLFKKDLLYNTIKEMLELAKDSLELVSDQFAYLGVYQYRKTDEPEISAKITIDNVIQFLGRPLTDIEKIEILSEDFVSLDVNYKRTLVFE